MKKAKPSPFEGAMNERERSWLGPFRARHFDSWGLVVLTQGSVDLASSHFPHGLPFPTLAFSDGGAIALGYDVMLFQVQFY